MLPGCRQSDCAGPHWIFFRQMSAVEMPDVWTDLGGFAK